MGEIINLSEQIKNGFEMKKEKYPNLVGFVYDENEDTLTYNGQVINNAGYALNKTAPVFFEMVPQDIFEYLKNGFCFQSPNEISKIKSMITSEMVITEEEIAQLKTFVRQYITKLGIYIDNKILFEQGIKDEDLNDFLSNLLERKHIIDGIKTGIYPHSIAANIIESEYDALTNNVTLENTDQTPDNSLEKGMSLTRKSPKTISYIFPEQSDVDAKYNKSQRLGISGFTSIVLIIATAVTFGMFLALKLM